MGEMGWVRWEVRKSSWSSAVLPCTKWYCGYCAIENLRNRELPPLAGEESSSDEILRPAKGGTQDDEGFALG